MALVGTDLGLTRRLLQVGLHHLLAHGDVSFAATQALAHNFLQLHVQDLLDVLVNGLGSHHLLIGSRGRLNRPQRQRVGNCVELLLSFDTLLAQLYLVTPNLTVGLLSVLLCPEVTLLLFVVLADLIVEFFALLNEHIDLFGQIVTEILAFVLLHVDQFGVVLQQAEGVDGGIGDTRTQVRCVDVCRLQFLNLRVL